MCNKCLLTHLVISLRKCFCCSKEFSMLKLPIFLNSSQKETRPKWHFWGEADPFLSEEKTEWGQRTIRFAPCGAVLVPFVGACDQNLECQFDGLRVPYRTSEAHCRGVWVTLVAAGVWFSAPSSLALFPYSQKKEDFVAWNEKYQEDARKTEVSER